VPTLHLQPNVLEWAAHQAGLTLEGLTDRLARKPSVRDAILAGSLTPNQIAKAAKLAGVPYGFLFLAEPPVEFRAGIPDLRQSPEADPLNADFFEVLEDARRKQQWFRDYQRNRGAPPPSVAGAFSGGRRPDADKLAKEIRAQLKLSDEDRTGSADAEEYFSALAARAENAGILVLKSGIVRSSTKRPLSPKLFRGFALADSIAPLVFVNGRDWQVAWVFTLIHEIAHIFIGESGVSDLFWGGSRSAIETLCNAAAAEVLVPRGQFLAAYAELQDLGLLAKRFRVSRLVAARRALDLGRITRTQYDEVAAASSKARPPQGKGGNPYATIPVRNSRKFTKAVVGSALEGRTLFREAASLLNVKPDTVAALGRRQGNE